MNELKYIIDDAGNRTDVVIPINEYAELLEDIEDLTALAARID